MQRLSWICPHSSLLPTNASSLTTTPIILTGRLPPIKFLHELAKRLHTTDETSATSSPHSIAATHHSTIPLLLIGRRSRLWNTTTLTSTVANDAIGALQDLMLAQKSLMRANVTNRDRLGALLLELLSLLDQVASATVAEIFDRRELLLLVGRVMRLRNDWLGARAQILRLFNFLQFAYWHLVKVDDGSIAGTAALKIAALLGCDEEALMRRLFLFVA